MDIPAEELKNVDRNSNLEELWTIYKREHNRIYDDAEEDKRRFGIFTNNVKKVIEHNEKHARGEVTFKMGINHFTDKLPEEIPGGLKVKN